MREDELAEPTLNFPLPHDSQAMERFVRDQIMLGEHSLEGKKGSQFVPYTLCDLPFL